MTTVLQKTLDFDLDKRPIDIRQWAEKTLDEQEFNDFCQAEKRNNDLMDGYISAGLLKQETITDKVFVARLNDTVTIPVGYKITLAPGVTILDIPIDPEFGAWQARYSSDPQINYHPTVQL